MIPIARRFHISFILILSSIFSHQVAAISQSESKTLWQIGADDGDNREFALAPDGYNRYAADGFFAVGRSEGGREWPFIQPGPADGWAGSKSHDFQIVFAIKNRPTSAGHLIIELLDTQANIPPRVRVTVNDFSVEKQLPRGSGDSSLSGHFEGSKAFEWDIAVPTDKLKTGANRVDITSLSGSWMLYDAVRFEAPNDTPLGEIDPVWVQSVQPQPFLDRGKNAKTLVQPIIVSTRNFGPPVTAVLRLNGADQQVTIPSGSGKVTFDAPETSTENQSRFTVEVGGRQIVDAPVTLKPVRHWSIYLLAHSHVDIGYTQPQESVRLKQIANLQEALALIKRTANYPIDAQFKWNMEVLWPMEEYLRKGTPAQRTEFYKALRSGKLNMNAYFGNLLTGLCSPEELLKASAPSLRVAKAAGITPDTAMQTDTPGYTWGNVTAMAQAGVKYFSMGPNAGDRTGGSLIRWHDKPFYWRAPSGKSKVLCWMTYGGYSLGHNLDKKLIPFLPGYLNELEATKYPYDITCLRWCVNGDNGSPDEALADTVRNWNAAHAFPHLVIAATREPFVALEKRYAKQIPVLSGDFTPYWEDGAASTARETALKRNATDRLVQAQTLWAMQNRKDFPAEQFRSAWEDALLYSEHTWGAYNSISEPDAEFVKSEWAYKRAFALRADSKSRQLLRDAAGNSAKIDVFNTQSWTRTDLALIPAAQSKAGDRVLDAAGKIVPSQRLADGTLAVLVRDIPALSSKRYSVTAGKAPALGAATVKGNVIWNGSLSATVDSVSGAITDLHSRGIAGNLVATKSGAAVNEYLYLPGGNLKDLSRSSPGTVTIEDSGPLVATLRIDSDAPGAHHLARRVRIISGIERLDLSDTVDKKAIREKEGVHIGFGFNVPNPTMRMDMPLSVVRPEIDQLPAANKNWYPVQKWVDVSNEHFGVTWATVDAPLVEVGGITANMPGVVPQTDTRWVQHIASSSIFYSWVMNNHWHTNYKADQEGPVTFRYSITPHGVFKADAAARFGTGISQPLIASPARSAATKGSLLKVSSPSVLVSEIKPSDDGEGTIVRLWGASGQDETVRLIWKGKPLNAANLSDTAESVGAKVGPDFSVPGYGIVTLRIAG